MDQLACEDGDLDLDIRETDLEVGHVDQLTVLVAREDGDERGPVTLKVVGVADHLALLGVQVRVRLQPPGNTNRFFLLLLHSQIWGCM